MRDGDVRSPFRFRAGGIEFLVREASPDEETDFDSMTRRGRRESTMAHTATDRVPANTSTENDALRARQMAQAEELLFSEPPRESFAKALFRGEFHAAGLFPYPTLSPAEKAETDEAVAKVRAFVDVRVDPAAIDRDADIPSAIIEGLANLGVLGMTAPKEFGGAGSRNRRTAGSWK